MPRSTGQSARLYWPQLFNPACAGRVLILRNLLIYHDAFSIFQQHDAGCLVPAYARPVLILRSLLQGG